LESYPPESLLNAKITLPLTKKEEEKVEELSRRGTGRVLV
jgi:hypothetical protein